MIDTITNYTIHLSNAINKAEKNESKLIQKLLNIEGMSGKKTKHFYNNLLELPDSRLLEIGCWKGSTTCSLLYKNKATVTCIDSWHDFILNEQHNNVNKDGPINEFMTNINEYKGDNLFNFYNEDCFKIDTRKLNKYNIYIYDGEHTYESQYNALKYYINNMDDIFIYIVDDWNDEPVRRGTFDAIRDLQLTNIWNKEIRLTNNNRHTPPDIAYETWWNGVYICILQKNNTTH
jgi:hypothetical protein